MQLATKKHTEPTSHQSILYDRSLYQQKLSPRIVAEKDLYAITINPKYIFEMLSMACWEPRAIDTLSSGTLVSWQFDRLAKFIIVLPLRIPSEYFLEKQKVN